MSARVDNDNCFASLFRGKMAPNSNHISRKNYAIIAIFDHCDNCEAIIAIVAERLSFEVGSL